MKEQPISVQEMAFESIVQLLMVIVYLPHWKREEVHNKELLLLNLSSNCDENTLKLKLRVCT